MEYASLVEKLSQFTAQSWQSYVHYQFVGGCVDIVGCAVLLTYVVGCAIVALKTRGSYDFGSVMAGEVIVGLMLLLAVCLTCMSVAKVIEPSGHAVSEVISAIKHLK